MTHPPRSVRLTPKGIKPVRNGHPWIFRNALAGTPAPGGARQPSVDHDLVWKHTEPVCVSDPGGVPLGWGIWNAASRLAVRMISHEPGQTITGELIEKRVARAVARRDAMIDHTRHSAYRVVFGEADGLPGVVVDRFGAYRVLQISSAFAWDNRDRIAGWVAAASGCDRAAVMMVPDMAMLAREGISERVVQAELAEPGGYSGAKLPSNTLSDATSADASSTERCEVLENGLRWRVYPGAGQKTGFYCDQRENRARIASCARGRRVLDVFSYHGGFGLTAAAHGAQDVCFIDSSADALALVAENAELQGYPHAALTTIQGDAFTILRENLVPDGIAAWDLVILDPPKLAPARKDVDRAMRAYKDLNLAVIQNAAPGTLLATFSCSGVIDWVSFRRVLGWAAHDAGRTVRIIAVLPQGSDHPVPLSFPEAEYLTGYLLEIE